MAAKISVLYVDDEPGLLEIGKLFLERSGQFSVDITTSASAALDMLSQSSYDAIISDFQMPGMDGITLLKKIRGSGNTIPFIILTGRGSEDIVIQALNEGASYYLQKGGKLLPQFTEIAHQVRHAVQKRNAETDIGNLEHRVKNILDFLPEAVFTIDRNGTVTVWNAAIEIMTGIPAKEILGKGDCAWAVPFFGEPTPMLVNHILAPDLAVPGRYGTIARKGSVLVAETILTQGNGASVVLEERASPLLRRNGEIDGAIELVRKISKK